MSDPTRYLCVYCGSSMGSRPSYAQAARRVGDALGRRGFGLVYGGGRVGLMGVVADAVLAAGGKVIGVIPVPLALEEIAHDTLTELHVVPGMHERKALMAERASGFLTLPGGVGTYEEFFEILTWAALGLHAKPIGVLNVDGYFDPLLRLLDHAVAEGFVRPEHLKLLRVSSDPEALAAALVAPTPSASGSPSSNRERNSGRSQSVFKKVLPKFPRISLGGTSFLVLILAMNFSVIRAAFDDPPTRLPYYCLSLLLPMIDALLICMFRLRKRVRRTGWTVGFLIGGWAATALILTSVLLAPDKGLNAINRIVTPIAAMTIYASQIVFGEDALQYTAVGLTFEFVFEVLFPVAFFCLPALIAALACGWVARRFRPTTE